MISVVIPVRDEEEHLGSCLEALQNQGLSSTDYEIVAVDDGSRDRSPEIAKSLGARLIHQSGQGPSAARNIGIRAARGETILLLDADCLAPPDWIERLTAPILSGEADVTVGRYESDQTNWVASLIQLELEQRYERMSRHGKIDYVNSGSSAFRRQILLDHPFDESYRKAGMEDVELSFRLAGNGARMRFMPELAVKHSHPTEFSHYLRRKFYYAARAYQIYRKYPSKTLGDASTPQRRRLQMVAIGLAGVLAPFSLKAAGVCLAVWLLLSVHFIAGAFRKSFALGLLAPGFLLAGNIAFVLGTLWGIIPKKAR